MSALPRNRRAAAVCAALALIATACNDDGREMREPSPDQTLSIITTTLAPDGSSADAADAADAAGMGHDDVDTMAGFEVSLPWADGGTIPDRHTCAGAGLSPAIAWVGLPAGTADIAVVARTVDGTVHWVLAGIAPATSSLDEGSPPPQAVVGLNTAGGLGWDPPCPAPGTTELLRIEVHALGQQVELQSGDPVDVALGAIDAVTFATAVGTGIATG